MIFEFCRVVILDEIMIREMRKIDKIESMMKNLIGKGEKDI